MKPTDKLIERLNKEFQMGIPEGTEVRRTYAGANQRSSGAFSWFFYDRYLTWVNGIGSCYPVKDLVKAKRISTLYYKDSSRFTEIIVEE